MIEWFNTPVILSQQFSGFECLMKQIQIGKDSKLNRHALFGKAGNKHCVRPALTIWERTYVIHKFLNLSTPLTILRITVDSDQIKPIIPPFVNVLNSITGKSRSESLADYYCFRDWKVYLLPNFGC